MKLFLLAKLTNLFTRQTLFASTATMSATQKPAGIKSRPTVTVRPSPHEEWATIREIFVQSFRRYPLYKYMVPDDSKRDEFLRAYLDANYEVTVGNDDGVLLGIKIPADVNNNSEQKGEAAGKEIIVGGVLFVPPAKDGCGWAIGSDEPYWEAYEKHGLAKISPEGLERVKRYEAWENDYVTQRAAKTHMPMWNGLFCAIAPEHSSQGMGSAVYKDVMRIIGKYKRSRVTPGHDTVKGQVVQPAAKEGLLARLFKSISIKHLHRFTLLNHRPIPLALLSAKIEQEQDKRVIQQLANEPDVVSASPTPLVAAISHSERSASFHESNGFHPVSRVPYYDVDGSIPFYTHMLVLDPFRTGKVPEFRKSYLRAASSVAPRKESKSVSVSGDFLTIDA